jgi:broad specificity phosphatase PhoE
MTGSLTPVRVILIRHAHPRGGYGDDHDPGLDDVGLQQAAAMREVVGPLGPMPIYVSPLRRTRETAGVLEQQWATPATIEPRVGEIPSPIDSLAERTTWLRAVLRGTWAQQAGELTHWRDQVLATLRELGSDAVVVTHFVAINAVVGAATGDERLVSCMPDYCSQTVVDVDATGFKVIEMGAQASTQIR